MTPRRCIRVDRVELQLVDDTRTDASPSPGRGVARITPEGYLEVDTYVARDGVLVYSDGKSSWGEYRDRAELERAASSFAGVELTDDHPPVMLDASNRRQYSRGVVLGTPTVVDDGGVAYLRSRLSFRDAELVRKIRDGQRELSIGAYVDVVPKRGVTRDGKRFDALQTNIAGNHIASVDEGRAGPECAVLFDGVRAARYAFVVPASSPSPKRIGSKTPPHGDAGAPSLDAAGSPVTEADITGPEGTVVSVPTWLASAYEFACQNGWAGMGAKPAEPAAAPEAPAADEAGAAPNPEDEKKPPMPAMTPDAVTKLVDETRTRTIADSRRRSRLDRLALAAGIAEDKIDAASDAELAALYVATALPHAKPIADKAATALAAGPDADAAARLDALVEVAALQPKPPKGNPFEIRARVDASADDPMVADLAAHLAR